jgi:PKD repeat protein
MNGKSKILNNMKKNKGIFLGIALALIITGSCKKDDTSSGTKAVFSYIADGFKVNFTNFSTNATEYVWDFGDQSTGSTLSNPTHVFTKKGQYLVSLTAKKLELISTFIDTVLILGPNIKIDGDFTDWAYVEYNHLNEAGTGGTIRAVKTFASAGYLNFLLEGNADFALNVVDIYLDSDNNPETGLKTWMYPAGSGADFLFEGSVPGEWGDAFAHVGPGNDWNWESAPISFAEAVKFSSFKTADGRKIVEFSIKRSGLGTLSGSVNFAIIESNEGWTEIGAIPLDQTPESIFVKMPL